MLIAIGGMLLIWGAWLFGSGLRRRRFWRVVGSLVMQTIGLDLIGVSGERPAEPVPSLLLLATLLAVAAGLLKRPPAREPKPEAVPLAVPAVAPASPAPPRAAPAPDLDWTVKLPDGPNLLLRYRDAAGETTDREIRPRGIKGRGRGPESQALSITGYCLTSKGPRTFKVKRILTAADPETGEVLDLAQWIRERLPDR